MAQVENTTKKLTKAETCTELARLTGWEGIFTTTATQLKFGIPPGLASYDPIPDFFTSRDAAAELVAWFARQDEDYGPPLQFVNALCRSIGFNAQNTSLSDLLALLRATPEQIALAACAALRIKVEDEAK